MREGERGQGDERGKRVERKIVKPFNASNKLEFLFLPSRGLSLYSPLVSYYLRSNNSGVAFDFFFVRIFFFCFVLNLLTRRDLS